MHPLNTDAREAAQSSQKVSDTRRNAGRTVSQGHNVLLDNLFKYYIVYKILSNNRTDPPPHLGQEQVIGYALVLKTIEINLILLGSRNMV